jgi:hypothetical protein
MERMIESKSDSMTQTDTAAEVSPNGSPQEAAENPELQEAQERLSRARKRLLSAAIAFCDGLISPGQLRAVRELLKEQELRITKLTGEAPPPFIDTPPPSAPSPSVPAEPIPSQSEPEPAAEPPLDTDLDPDEVLESLRQRTRSAPEGPADPELEALLNHLDDKIAHLEQDYQQGRINASQYRAIRRHYLEQHEVALRLHQANPRSDRWKVVLEEGKTNFLMQLNEAECRCIAFFDISDRSQIYVQGELPEAAEDAMRFLSTFGHPPGEQPSGRMFATQTENGDNLLLIPGRFTAALVVFSDEPPGWQVRALREVQRNFEAANHGALERGERKSLVFPDLNRFFRK